MQQSEFKVSISVESYDDKTAENYPICYDAENHKLSKLSEIVWWKLCQNFPLVSFIFSEYLSINLFFLIILHFI